MIRWYNAIAFRVLLSRLAELGAAFTVSTALRLGPLRELPIGLSGELHLWDREDGFRPAIGCSFALVLIVVDLGLHAPDPDAGGWFSRQETQRGIPPFVGYSGRWFWAKWARSW